MQTTLSIRDGIVRMPQWRMASPVNVELLMTHQIKVVPERLLKVGRSANLRVLVLHLPDDGLRTTIALVLGRQADSQVYHLLDLPPVFRHHQFLSLGVVV